MRDRNPEAVLAGQRGRCTFCSLSHNVIVRTGDGGIVLVTLKKYHGLGNDYLIYDPNQNRELLQERQIQLLCRRNTGVGADSIHAVGFEGDMINESVFFCDNFYNITCVSMGNPNCVVMMEEISKNKALHLGPYVENSKYFPNRINMQLCHVVDRENIQIEIYERGAGYTYASGTGACAAASAAHKLGLVGNRVQVHMQGGDLLVEFAEDDRVFMTGPVVYIGSITLAENFFA